MIFIIPKVNLGLKIVCVFAFLISGIMTSHTFWQISDTHVNYCYRGSTSNTAANGCSRGTGNTGNIGDYKCDTPYWTFRSGIKQMKEIDPNPDFILFSGDLFGHKDTTSFALLKVFEKTIVTIKKHFPNIPLIYSLGNTDLWPRNNFSSETHEDYLTEISTIMSDDFDDEQKKTWNKYGYYSTIIQNKLRVVTLNTIIYYVNNKLTKGLGGDVYGQLAWLKNQVKLAKENDQMVIVHGHVPAGIRKNGYSSYKTHFNNYVVDKFNSIESEYPGIIKLYVFGHKHRDTLRITHAGTPMLCAPSFSFYYNVNSALARHFQYDLNNKVFTSYQNYWSDLNEANEDEKIIWKPLYNTTQSPMNFNNLNNENWVDFIYELEHNNDTFQIWYERRKAMYPMPICDELCKKDLICLIKTLTKTEYFDCME
ncbi:sphingomyelin phosphodiesterase [Anaeramoeba flamelloides]|uniref:Sphingomyelin phosphodiesterase n=1 Tax=Anaeramoeba flamelloides TaxID=1746091 RepID=A0ABQ8ZF87_9EUKA|nr:sphingomyelin phosphodiesterase [Anaeramoeba flamelloides]